MTMVIDRDTKPSRPFGVTVAIVLMWLFFALIPSLTIGIRLAIEDYLSRPQTIMLPDGSLSTAITGIQEEDRIPEDQIMLQLAITFMVTIIAYFAWRGKPKVMRYILMAAVLVIAGVLILQSYQLTQASESTLEGGSAHNVVAFLCDTQILFLVLVPLYVVWYVNRAPARAFYRGYYLPEEIEQIEALFRDRADLSQ